MLETPELLAELLQDSGGGRVTFGAHRTYGHVEIADEAVLQEAGIKGVKLTLVIAHGTLPGVRQDSAITVATGRHAGNYTVRDLGPVDGDGALHRLYLKRV